MLESSSRYLVASQEFMGKAYQYLAENDLRQASEKGWGAAAEIVKAVAEERGWPHDAHRLLYDAIHNLERETGITSCSACSRWHPACISTSTRTGCIPRTYDCLFGMFSS